MSEDRLGRIFELLFITKSERYQTGTRIVTALS